MLAGVLRIVPRIIVFAALALACSGRSIRHEGDASGAAAGGTGTTGSGGMSGSAGKAGSGAGRSAMGGSAGSAVGVAGAISVAGAAGAAATECLLAVRFDQCCAAPEPVTRAAVDADPCWRVWPVVGGAASRPGCTPPPCPELCPSPSLPSRTVEPDSSGGCRFASECRTADDCIFLRDATSCCSCAEPFPTSLVGSSVCLVTPESSSPAPCGSCETVDCDACALPSKPVACLPSRDGLAHCTLAAVLDLTPTQCAAEQSCGAIPGQGCTQCLPPGAVACGGPPPQPADCTSDAECQAQADNLICEPLPCQEAHCIQGCLIDEDCGASEVCREDLRCVPRFCEVDDDCTGNFRCDNGSCTRRSCTSSLECDGFCVLGLCYEDAGSCQDGCIP